MNADLPKKSLTGVLNPEFQMTVPEIVEQLKSQRAAILASYGAHTLESPGDVPPDEYRDYTDDPDVLADLEALDHAIDLLAVSNQAPFHALLLEVVKARIRYLDRHGTVHSRPDGRPFTFCISERLTLAEAALGYSNPHQARFQLLSAAERTLAAVQAIDETYPPPRTD